MPSHHPTPITTALEALGVALSRHAQSHQLSCAAELRHAAAQLDTLARRTALLERFHAELIAEAAEEELRQPGLPAHPSRQFGRGSSSAND